MTLPLRLTPAGAPSSRPVAFRHAEHAKTQCASCHTDRASVKSTTACASCHERHHTAADHLTCASCHARATVALPTPDRAFCVSCHAAQADHKPNRECSACHLHGTPSELRRGMSKSP